MNFDRFGKNVSHRLIDKGMKMIDLAAKVSATPSAISKICHNQRKPSCEMAIKIADALGTTVDALMKGDMSNAERKSRVSRHD